MSVLTFFANVLSKNILPKTDNNYMIFMNNKFIGLQLLPLDGNPYKYSACLAHQHELADFCTSSDGQYVFTYGKHDKIVSMWRIHLTAVDTMYRLGGTQLQPFYCMLEGGRNGWLFHEMQDLFYYMQILHQGETNPMKRVAIDSIEVDQLADLIRACGFYPSDYDIENMITDVTYRDYYTTGLLRKQLTFCEFVQLFINYKPAYGYSIDELEQKFETFTDGSGSVSSDEFIDLFTNTGEMFDLEKLQQCLKVLLNQSDEAVTDFLPKTIDFETLTEDILGIQAPSTPNSIDQ